MEHNPMLEQGEEAVGHKPIKEKCNLGPSLLSGDVNLDVGTLGALYDGAKCVRVVRPGDKRGWSERNRRLTLYVVDAQPHVCAWRVDLPTRDDEEMFPLLIEFEYRVADAEYMINNHVNDTEKLLQRTLEPHLRRQTRDFAINEYRAAISAVEEWLNSFPFDQVGLAMMRSADVRMDFTGNEELRQLIRELDKLQQIPHRASLPARDTGYNFEATVTLTYRVTDLRQLPTRSPREAEEWLWKQIENELRALSRKFAITAVDQAEAALQSLLNTRRFADYGLEVVSALVSVTLDEKSIEKARQLADSLGEIRSRTQIEQLEAELDTWRRSRELDLQRDALSFYQPLIKQGQWALLALMLSQDPNGAEKILAYLNNQQREALSNQMEILKHMVGAGGLEGWDMEPEAKELMQVLVQRFTHPLPELPDVPATQQLGTTQDARASDATASD